MAEYGHDHNHNKSRSSARARASNRNKIINRIVIVPPRHRRRLSW
jgi:hypothetical protein